MISNEDIISCISFWAFLFLLFILLCLFCCCTLSFQNISTHGVATDLVDETQSTEPKIDTSLQMPAM